MLKPVKLEACRSAIYRGANGEASTELDMSFKLVCTV
jgi:hypothetical protein